MKKKIQKIIFGCYFRHQRFLTNFLEWLAKDKNILKKITIRILAKGMARYFIVAKKINNDQATQMINNCTVVGITNCVCKGCYENKEEKKCLFIDLGFEVYSKNGPYKIFKISKSEALKKIKELTKKDYSQITPINPLNTWIFPNKYCICNCKLDHCMPIRFREKYGIKEAYTEKMIRYNPFHNFIFYISLLLTPLFLIIMIYYKIFIEKQKSN